MKKIILALGFLIYCFNVARSQCANCPWLTDSVLTKQLIENKIFEVRHTDVALTRGDLNEKGLVDFIYYIDSTRTRLFKAIRIDSTKNLMEYFIIYYIDNKIAKSETWRVSHGLIDDYLVTYYKDDKVVFPAESKAKGSARKSFAWLGNELFMVSPLLQ